MDLAQVARVLARFCALFAVVQALPLVFAWTEPRDGGVSTRAGFLAGVAASAATALLLWLAGRRATHQMFRRESIGVAGLSWILAGVLGAIPLQWSGVLPRGIDALYESVSGLTTCGGTVLGTGGNPTPELAPHSILFWRALLHWLGGLGIVLLFATVLAPSQGGRRLLTVESVAIETDGDRPSVVAQTRTLMTVYFGLSAACALALWIVGMDAFEAVCHSFATIATGGFSTRTSIAEFDSVAIEVVLIVFMFLGGASFVGLGAMLRRGHRAEDGLLQSPEFRIYSLFTVAAVASVTIAIAAAGVPVGHALRQAAFNVVSIASCTGFATVDTQAWPAYGIVVLLFAMLVGGCSGSAAGGMKQIRFLVCLKLLAYTIGQFVRPRSVARIKLAGDPLPAAVISSVVSVVLLWLLAVLVGTAVLSFDPRLDALGALTTSASQQANAGPALGTIVPASAAAALLDNAGAVPLGTLTNIGPFGGFGDLTTASKLWLCFQMVLGRLELLTLLALFSRTTWRR